MTKFRHFSSENSTKNDEISTDDRNLNLFSFGAKNKIYLYFMQLPKIVMTSARVKLAENDENRWHAVCLGKSETELPGRWL